MKQYTDQGKVDTRSGFGAGLNFLLLFVVLFIAPCCIRKATEGTQTPVYYYEIKYSVNGSDSLYRNLVVLYRITDSYPHFMDISSPDTAKYAISILSKNRNGFYFSLTATLISDTSFFESGKYYPFKLDEIADFDCGIGNRVPSLETKSGCYSLTMYPCDSIAFSFKFEIDAEDFYTKDNCFIHGSADFTKRRLPFWDNSWNLIKSK